MKKNILLNKNRSKSSVNVENGLMVPISTNEHLIPFEDISDVVNLAQVYNDEKDTSKLYRLILTINPVCSNILFNTFTEVVYKEGDDSCVMLTDSNSSIKNKAVNSKSLNQAQAIRDTEYSHPKICSDLVYHCGTDMFNNHILRSNGFVVVSKLPKGNKTDIFNTIRDYNRDKNGIDLTIQTAGGRKTKSHIYNADNLLTFKEAFTSRLVEDNGWFGFTNTTLIDIPNVYVDNTMVTVNKVMNNNKSCEFIDMFPDRSLFSFIPKVNKYKNRLEYNWDYCLTYPYKNDYDKFQKLNNTENFKNFYGIKIVKTVESVSDNGGGSILFETMINHNLVSGDYVRLYYVFGGELIKSTIKTKVNGVGDTDGANKKRCFSTSRNSLDKKLYESLIESYDGNTDSFSLDVYFKKETQQGECDYYFRIFRKLPNFNTATKNIYDMNNDVEEVIKTCKKDYFKSEINKLSFSQNIYGDKESQIVFTDTIDLTRLTDNNGRELSEIYLTIVKRNQGYKSWYNGIYHDNKQETVEFSRAFGEVTSGLDMSPNENCFNFNVRRLHNVTDDIISQNEILDIPERPESIEKNLTIKGKSIGGINGLFYGDIVEMNPNTCLETTLEKVYHRFNTAQRETASKTYSKLRYDVLFQDDNIDDFSYGSNSSYNDFMVAERFYGQEDGVKNANIAPEGYFYQPHFKIKINEINEFATEVDGTLINFDNEKVSIGDNNTGSIVKIKSPKNYDFKYNDVFILYERDNFKNGHYWGFLTNVISSTEIEIVFEEIKKSSRKAILDGIKEGKYILVKTNDNIPCYAIPSKSIPYKFKWKTIVKPSAVPSDSDITKRPFTNGTHYIHNNINFYLRRQDPFGDYELQYGVRDGVDSYNPMIDLTPYGDYKDITSYEYYSEDDYNPCIV